MSQRYQSSEGSWKSSGRRFELNGRDVQFSINVKLARKALFRNIGVISDLPRASTQRLIEYALRAMVYRESELHPSSKEEYNTSDIIGIAMFDFISQMIGKELPYSFWADGFKKMRWSRRPGDRIFYTDFSDGSRNDYSIWSGHGASFTRIGAVAAAWHDYRSMASFMTLRGC